MSSPKAWDSGQGVGQPRRETKTFPPSAMNDLFDLTGRVAVVTGGTGVLGSACCRGLAAAGASIVVLARNEPHVAQVARAIETAYGVQAMGVSANVLDKARLSEARRDILERFGGMDILVNAAGGNIDEATLRPGDSIFRLPEAAFRQVFDLNLIGTMLPTQVFGEAMADRKAGGSMVNVSSMAANRTLTRVVGYSAAKASVENFTRWMAVELARTFGDGLRVNAVAPGFFVGEQNRHLLSNEDGSWTQRGRTIIDHTPMGRFGEADELAGTIVWLCSDASKFVTGIVVPVDGGFSAFSGV